MAWLEISGTDQTSKMESFDYFCRALYLGCLVSSSYATVFLSTFSHVVFSGLTITGTSEMDSFSEYNQWLFSRIIQTFFVNEFPVVSPFY